MQGGELQELTKNTELLRGYVALINDGDCHVILVSLLFQFFHSDVFILLMKALHNAFNQPQSAQYMQWLMQQVAARQLAARQLAAQQFAAQQFAAQQLAAQQVAAQQATMDQEILHRVSMKIFGCEPQDLSPGILSEVERLLRVSPGEVSAYTRPGCVNITLDIWTHRHCLLPRDHNFARKFIMSLLPKK
jgi:hypothetical protein